MTYLRSCPERLSVPSLAWPLGWLFLLSNCFSTNLLGDEPFEWIGISRDGQRFELVDSQTPFTPWGFNYDHDPEGRLLEAYWDDLSLVETHLKRLADRGANLIRLHLQVGSILEAPDKVSAQAMERLQQVIAIAKRLQLRICLTGLGCYHADEVPDWYDALTTEARWEVQAFYWRSLATALKDEPTIFCYDLMNEPVVPGAVREQGQWLGPAFAGKTFVQFIALEPGDQPRSTTALRWTQLLVDSIREVDSKHLITVGLVPWSLDRPGLTSGFEPGVVGAPLDFISVHLYPESMKLSEASEVLNGFQIGKPVVVQEFFPLKCRAEEAAQFVRDHRDQVAGWLSFHWGQSDEELDHPRTIATALLAQWLDTFEQLKEELD